MNDIQRKAAAAGFIQALKESVDVRDQWLAYRYSYDWLGLRLFIQETLQLTQTPSPDDLEAMRNYAAEHLQTEADAVARIDKRILPKYIFNGMHPPPGGVSWYEPPPR
jgi:hypothetical protein